MKTIPFVAVATILALLPACGGGSGSSGSSGSGTCGAALPACGGTLDGTWRIASTCLRGDLNAALAATADNGGPLPAACSGLFQGFTLDAQGTATFANNQETDAITLSMSGDAVYTSACVNTLAGTSVTLTSSTCTALESGLTSSGDFTSASCTFSGGNCTCRLTKLQQAPTAPQPYTVSGGTITYTDPSDTPVQYCVSGNTLTVESPTGIPNITGENVLDKM